MSQAAVTAAGAVAVSGAAGAIGGAACRTLLDHGWAVFGMDLVEPAEPVTGRYLHAQVDVRDGDALREAAAALPPDYELCHLVCVAGGASSAEQSAADPSELTIATFRQALEDNLTSTFQTIQVFLPHLRRNASLKVDRSITVTSSINALVGLDLPAYSAAKAGLLALTRVLARQLGSEGIRVNAVVPGTVPSPRTEALWAADDGHFPRLAATSALGRLTKPSEVADCVRALAVELTAVTGQMLVVDAGQSGTRSY